MCAIVGVRNVEFKSVDSLSPKDQILPAESNIHE